MTEKQQLDLATRTLDEHKAEDIASIDVSGASPFADYVVLATCQNPRALAAVADHLEDAFAAAGVEVSAREGEPDSGWIVFLAGSVLVHLMLERNRAELNLEQFLEQLKDHHLKK